MTRTKQQEEAIRYFSDHAQDWQDKAGTTDLAEVNIIEQRNAFVLEVVAQLPGIRATLDIGCGTGDLVCSIAKQGIEATGIDRVGVGGVAAVIGQWSKVIGLV